ncbi:CoxG family protein [Kitasatospora camelliae]|uniref:Carbon monoxide dehydrogenase subunit G n=1 Tax=Kitasatospora camelliae TaxID=3156397 RepID=A0AAU8JW64_9ACTN
MEHEVVVPLPVEVVRQALLDHRLVGRCVPGLSAVEAESSPEEAGGRMRIRIGGSTITYLGSLSVLPWEEGVLTVVLSGKEVRGPGLVSARIRVALREVPDGTLLACSGEVESREGGRLPEFDAELREALARRMVDRTAAALTEELSEPDGGADDAEDAATVVYLEDRAVEQDLDDDLSDLIAFSDEPPAPGAEPEGGEPGLPYEPEPALAGPVKRSIVGRSAEEVDHAPPRGRYAPAPPAHSARARAASRWGGVEPTALSGGGERSAVPWMIGGGVALIGGAVVLVRALRRR